MTISNHLNRLHHLNRLQRVKRLSEGFTLVEVIIAAGIMVILCIGTLTVFSHASKINSGNNLRAQAQSVLQLEAEYYRSLKFIPIGSDSRLNAGTYSNPRLSGAPDVSADGQSFNINVVISNTPYGGPAVTDADCKFKQITITATPVTFQSGWLSNLNTTLAIQRVRAN
jgi:type II secretory pathway pseudopilin PulG